MTIHELSEAPPPELARALAEFESRFTYPLGPGRSFRISHGEDYPRFFRAIGRARSFIAERAGRVIGAVSIAICPLICPDGSIRNAAYIGDLKVDPAARNTRAFIRLARAADAWARPQVTAAFGVVMDETRTIPTTYTGRAGIEPFHELGKLSILRFPTTHKPPTEPIDAWLADEAQGKECHRKLSAGRFTTSGGTATIRSQTAPQWLAAPDNSSCGRLEDTRIAKRLIDSDNAEMQSAHLSRFAYRDTASAARLIPIARHCAAARGFPALFVAIAQSDMPAFEPALADIDKLIAPATIYGAGLPADFAWNINTSEI